MELVQQILILLGINAVPVAGVALGSWNAATALMLYWFENLLIAAFTCVRIAVHRKLTRKRGHWRPGQLGLLVNGKPSQAGLLGEYATMSFVFTLAHGVFVGMIVLVVGDNYSDDAMWQFSGAQFRQGAAWIALVLALELALDLASIRTLSYAALKSAVQVRVGRVFVLHLTIILGMFAMLLTQSPYAILYTLIAFKTVWEMATTGSAQAKATTLHATMAAQDAPAQGDTATQRRIALEDEQVMPA